MIKNTKNNDLIEKYLKPNIYNYLCGLLKQNVEKMNKIRLIAGESLQEFFYEFRDFKILNVPNFEEIKEIYSDDILLNEFNQIKNSEWQDPSYSYRKIIKILSFKDYSFNLVIILNNT